MAANYCIKWQMKFWGSHICSECTIPDIGYGLGQLNMIFHKHNKVLCSEKVLRSGQEKAMYGDNPQPGVKRTLNNGGTDKSSST